MRHHTAWCITKHAVSQGMGHHKARGITQHGASQSIGRHKVWGFTKHDSNTWIPACNRMSCHLCRPRPGHAELAQVGFAEVTRHPVPACRLDVNLSPQQGLDLLCSCSACCVSHKLCSRSSVKTGCSDPIGERKHYTLHIMAAGRDLECRRTYKSLPTVVGRKPFWQRLGAEVWPQQLWGGVGCK